MVNVGALCRSQFGVVVNLDLISHLVVGFKDVRRVMGHLESATREFGGGVLLLVVTELFFKLVFMSRSWEADDCQGFEVSASWPRGDQFDVQLLVPGYHTAQVSHEVHSSSKRALLEVFEA